jgi:hypothetical protein
VFTPSVLSDVTEIIAERLGLNQLANQGKNIAGTRASGERAKNAHEAIQGGTKFPAKADAVGGNASVVRLHSYDPNQSAIAA